MNEQHPGGPGQPTKPAPSDPHPGQTTDVPAVPGSNEPGDPLKEAK